MNLNPLKLFFASPATPTEAKERKAGPRKNWVVSRKTAIDDFHMPVGVLTDPDEVLRLNGLNVQHAYDEIMTDDHLTAIMGSRLAAVNSLEWDITRGKAGANVHKAVLKQFEQSAGSRMIDMQGFFRDIMEKNPWGIAPIKVDWKIINNMWWIKSFTGMPSWYFKYNDDNEIRFMSITDSTNGEEPPKYRLLVARNNPTYTNPYGEKLLSKSYWPISWKRNVIKWWNVFVEKFSIPALVGVLPDTADDNDSDKMLEQLDNMVADSVMTRKESDKVETLEPSGKRASSDIFLGLIKWADSAISKIWLGETLTTEMGPTGSYAASKTHEGTKNERRDTDVHEIEFLVNEAIRWFVDINFGAVEAPVFIMQEPFSLDETKSKIDKVLSNDLGVKFNKEYIESEYGKSQDHFEIVEKKPEPPPGPGPNPNPDDPDKEFQLSTADEKALDKAFQDLNNKELQKQAEQILNPFIKLIKDSGGFDEALSHLLDVVPKMDIKRASKQLNRAVFSSEVWGRLNAK